MAVKPIPDGYHTVTPYLVAKDAEQLLKFLNDAFGAKEHDITRGEDGSIWHADMMVGDSHIMLSQANERFQPTSSAVYLYVPDTDATYRAALAAGGTSVMEPADQFYGDRNAGVKDAQGNFWWIGTHVEDVAPDEMQRRTKAAAAERARAATTA
ncbi:MAG TPA: VOC family protein [Vicinamibacterales bacterium]